MSARIRDHDWSEFGFGAPEQWSCELHTIVGLCLSSELPAAVYWGPEWRLIYNDACARLLPAGRHPWALGRPASEIWRDIWPVIQPQLEQVVVTGKGLAKSEQLFFLDRDDRRQETYWTYSLTPVREHDGSIAGVFVQGSESTAQMFLRRTREAQLERLQEAESAEVTERVQAALRASEERLSHALSAGGGIGTWDWDIRSGIVTADERFAQLYGVDPQRAGHGAPLNEFLTRVHPEDLPHLQRAMDDALITCDDFGNEYRIVTEEGRVRWVAARGRCSRDDHGTPTRFAGVTFDITERKLVEQALQRAMENREFALDLAHRQRERTDPEEIMQATAQALGERLQADRVGFYRMSGDAVEMHGRWSRGALPLLTGQFPAASLGAFIHADRPVALDNCRLEEHAQPESPAMDGVVAALAVPLARAGRPEAGLYVHHARARHWTSEEIALVEETAESAWGAIERAIAELALRDSEERFRAIANSVDQMIWVARPDGYHEYYNERWYEYTGVPEGSTDGDGWNGVFHPDDRQRAWGVWRHSLATGEPYQIEYRLRHRSGHYRWVLGRAQPVRDRDGRIVRWFGTCTDIQDIVDAREVLTRSREDLEREVQKRTQELMAAEEQLRQAQKMEAIGQLTGGIAHDFNNMLAVIMGGLNLLQRRLARGDTDVAKYIDGVMEGANRAAVLTQRLLAFSRQQPLTPEPIDANRMVAGMTELLTRVLGDDICIETVLGAELWTVKADPNQLENALLNLAVNARDAMPDGGRLKIETSNAQLNEREAREYSIARGEYVLVRLRDTGTGMAPEVAAKAFDPFFTTKAVGKGTGLGLSQVFGFVRQSGGHVKIDSEVGVGTTLTIYLPRYDGAADAGSIAEPAERIAGGRPEEVVLVVEDEPRVRGFSVEALRELGYTAVAADSPSDALRRIDSGQHVDLLFTDIVMPEIGGLQLAEAVKERAPDVKVLFTTGYSRNTVAQEGLDPSVNFLPKPFGIEQLAAKVRNALDARG